MASLNESVTLLASSARRLGINEPEEQMVNTTTPKSVQERVREKPEIKPSSPSLISTHRVMAHGLPGATSWSSYPLEEKQHLSAQHVFDGMFERQELTTSHVIHVTVTCVLYPVTEKVLHQILDVYGVNEVCVLQKPTHVEAFVEFQSWHEASKARGGLHGRCIYDGCCFLDIQHAPPSISIHMIPNSEPFVVDWDRVEVEPLTSSPPSASTPTPTSTTEAISAAGVVQVREGACHVAAMAANTDKPCTYMMPTKPQVDYKPQDTYEQASLGDATQMVQLISEGSRELLTHVGGVSLFLEQVVNSTVQFEGICSMKRVCDEYIADPVLDYVGGLSLFLEEGLGSRDEMFEAVAACHENTFSFPMVDVSAEGTMFELLPSWRYGGFSPEITIANELLRCSSRDHLLIHWDLDGLQSLRWGTSHCKLELTLGSLLWDPGGSWFACLVLNSELFAGYTTGYSMRNLLRDSVFLDASKSVVIAVQFFVQWDPGIMKIPMHAMADIGKLLGRQLRNPTTGNPFSHGYVKKEPMLYNSVDTSRFEGDTTATGLEQAFNVSCCKNVCSLFHFTSHLQYKQWDPGVWELLGEEFPELSVAATRRITDRTSKLRKKNLRRLCNYKPPT